MLIIYRKSDGLVASNSGSNSYLPNGPAFEVEVANAIRTHGGVPEEYGEYRLNDNEQAETVRAILAAGSYELMFDEAGDPMGITIHERLTLTADKSQVIADDADTATITATIADPANSDLVTFEMDGVQIAQVTPENGEARLVLQFAPGNEGTKVIVATHPRFGRNEVRLEVVSGGA